MTDKLLQETRRTFTALAKRESKNVATIWRWAQRGVRGCVLESFNIGGRRYTTDEAYARFVARTSGEKTINGQTPRQRESAISRAERAAEQMGV